MNLWALAVLLTGACHLSTHKTIREEDSVAFAAPPLSHACRVAQDHADERRCVDGPLTFHLRYVGAWLSDKHSGAN